eukprot:TRINITY_DN10102_c0_g1_i2.p1 TRINITY_DN10102_c0_g1~~TRINITY_DN10102_c0_g1_i2.p1  ORF type:complete len:575 (-),score=102.36 TRINITY_DN10102_c0_g1_i2:122-1846(-)
MAWRPFASRPFARCFPMTRSHPCLTTSSPSYSSAPLALYSHTTRSFATTTTTATATASTPSPPEGCPFHKGQQQQQQQQQQQRSTSSATATDTTTASDDSNRFAQWDAMPRVPPHPSGYYESYIGDAGIDAIVKWGDHGDLLRYHFFGRDTALLSNADLLQEAYQSTALLGRPKDPIFGYLYGIVSGTPESYGLIMRSGDDWKKHRSAANKALLVPKVTEGFAPHINQHARALVSQWKERDLSEPLKIKNLRDFSLAVIGKIGFGAEFQHSPAKNESESEPSEAESFTLATAIMTFFDTYREMTMVPRPFPEDNPAVKRVRKAAELLRTEGMALLRKKREKIEREGEESVLQVGNTDYLSLMACIRDDEGNYLPESELLTDISDVVSGGTDTLASFLPVSMYVLGCHPEITDKLREEIVRVAGRTGDITPQHLQEMPYLSNINKEILRLYPPAPANWRLALEDTTIGGVLIPRDSAVTMNTWRVQKDPRYFDDPERFHPERWDEKKHHPFAWTAFGAGARRCLGTRLGLMEARIALAHIVRSFKLEYTGSRPLPYMWAITLRPLNPVEVKLTPL